MLGIAALAQLALAQFPGGGVGSASPAWRRWLAQTYPGAMLNRVPTVDFTRNLVAHMLAEGERLYQGQYKKPEWLDLTAGADGLVVTAEKEEQSVTVFLPLDQVIAPKVVDDAHLYPDIERVIMLDGGGCRIVFTHPVVEQGLKVRVSPRYREDSDEDLIAILLTTIH